MSLLHLHCDVSVPLKNSFQNCSEKSIFQCVKRGNASGNLPHPTYQIFVSLFPYHLWCTVLFSYVRTLTSRPAPSLSITPPRAPPNRCSDPTECGSFVSALKCYCCADGDLLPAAPLDPDSAWECRACDQAFTIGGEEVDEVVGSARKELQDIDE